MYFKIITSTVFAASLAIIPPEQAEADAGDFIAGAIIGGIVGANAKKQRRTTRSTNRRYKKSTRSRLPSTQEGKTIQASLNYFGFNAGTVDGQLGRKTKNAVSQYQAYLGYPVTGTLSPFELNLLTTSYNRAQAGGYAVQQQVASNIDGTRGLLKTYRSEMAGTAPTTQGGATTIVLAPQPAPAPATQPTFAATAPAVQPLGSVTALAAAVTPTAPAAATALPNFMGAGTQASLASHCNTVSLITNTNGGFVTLAAMTDPNVALNEQFCLARTYAIAKSEEMVSQIQGFTPDQIAAQCGGFGPAMKDKVAALSVKPRDVVAGEVGAFAQTTGMSAAQLQGTAKICLGVGYRTDNMDVAVGSALLLYSLGEGVYGELMGHHLSQGFGPAKRADMAQSWYEAGLAAADSGAAAVFVPGQPERTELIRQAALRVNGGGALATQPLVQPASSSGLPTFSISE